MWESSVSDRRNEQTYFKHNLAENMEKQSNCFQTLIFYRNLGFRKLGICPRYPPPGGFIFPEMTPNKQKSGKWQTHQKSAFFDKLFSFFMHFFGVGPHPTPPRPTRPPHPTPKKNKMSHMGFEGVLTRQKWAGKWCFCHGKLPNL